MNDTGDSAAASLSKMLNYNLTQMIYVAARLGIPDLLADGPKSAEELAGAVGAHPRSLHRLLRALASQGVFTEAAQGHFENTSLSNLLRAGVPGSFRPFALSYGEPWWWNAWSGLLHSVQSGETAFSHVHGMSLYEFLDQNPEALRIFNANMTSMTSREAQAVVSAYDFSNSRLLVDVGGGHGALTIAILQAHPKTRAVLFDLPSVVAEAPAHLASAGIEGRCEVIGGNFFEAIPQGGDTVLLKDVLHNWDEDAAMTILRNCRRSMSHSGRLLIIERVIPPGNDPAIGKLVDISMLVLTGGRERTAPEYRALLEAAGFGLERIYPADAEISVIEAAPVKTSR